jgi:hypothetical protein
MIRLWPLIQSRRQSGGLFQHCLFNCKRRTAPSGHPSEGGELKNTRAKPACLHDLDSVVGALRRRNGMTEPMPAVSDVDVESPPC